MRVPLIVMSAFLGLCIVCMIVGYFAFLPRFQDRLESSIEEAVSTYVAPQISSLDGDAAPGEGSLTEEELNAEIASGDPNLEDLAVDITPENLVFQFGEQGRELTYTASVAAVDGRIEVTDATLDGIPSWVLSESSVSDGIEQGINNYLEANGLTLTDVTLGEGVMTFTTT